MQRSSVTGPKSHSLWDAGGGGPGPALSTPLVMFHPSWSLWILPFASSSRFWEPRVGRASGLSILLPGMLCSPRGHPAQWHCPVLFFQHPHGQVPPTAEGTCLLRDWHIQTYLVRSISCPTQDTAVVRRPGDWRGLPGVGVLGLLLILRGPGPSPPCALRWGIPPLCV